MTYLARIPPKSQLQPIDLVSPGFFGLNYAQSGNVLSPAYAVEARNAVIDSSGRLAARKGLREITDAYNSPVSLIHEYVRSDGELERWFALSSQVVSLPVGKSAAGTVERMLNFNGKLIALGTGFNGSAPFIVRTPSDTSFEGVVVSSGTAPTGTIACSAYGRLWITDGTQTIRYSGLLDETDWGSDSSGTIDMSLVWTQGTDIITAIWAFNGALVVFGRKHIVFWTDGRGSALGLDPTQMYVVDVIAGTGTVSQHTVQPVGDTDLLYLSDTGVQSLKRLLNERSAPVATLTKYVRPVLLADLQAADITKIRSAYSTTLGAYLLTFPDRGRVWVLDQRFRYADREGEECAVVTEWRMQATAFLAAQTGELLIGSVDSSFGVVCEYAGYTDHVLRSIDFQYKSPWLDLGEETANLLKMLKRVGAVMLVNNAVTVTVSWGTDFDTDSDTYTTVTDISEGEALWGEAEFGEAEWGAGASLYILKIPARARGQYFQLGVTARIIGEFALQQVELFTKIGRIA